MAAHQKVWFVTGATRGLGLAIAQAALAAGHRVVATGRDVDRVRAAVGSHDDLLALHLDVTDARSANDVAQAAIDAFGHIDVVVNNAGNFQAGFFEELTDSQYRAELEVNFFGPLNVTRAVLPSLRAQRSGHLVTLSSSAGITGGPFESAYAASKAALDVWAECVAAEVEQFGIRSTIINPGMFRTGLLVSGASALWAELSVDDYASQTAELVRGWTSNNGAQPGDPVKLGKTIVELIDDPTPPARFVPGNDGIERVERKGHALVDAVESLRGVATQLNHD